MLLLAGCAQPTPAPAPPTPALAPTAVVTPVVPPPTPTLTRPAPTATTRPAPTPTVTETRNLKTFHTLISFETYETEETVQLELGRLPGVASINVTQLDVTVLYDASRLSEDEILRTLRDNPEVRIKDDTRAGQ